MLIAVGFAISCFGLLLFLWLAFGGPVPLKSKSYRVTVPFNEATQLAVQSDVRISGVSVGKVESINLSDAGSYADAEIQIDPQYAPIPANTKAILRQKTLLGETYVELTPGDPSKGDAARGRRACPLPRSPKSVQLDEIFRTFDPQTRTDFRNWMQDAARRPAWPRRRPERGARQPRAVRAVRRRSDAGPRLPERRGT